MSSLCSFRQIKTVWLSVFVILISGCARYPSSMQQLGDRLVFKFTLKEEVNLNFYYFVFINNKGDATQGPFPIVYGPPWPGNTCATGYTHYVRWTMEYFASFIYDEKTRKDILSFPPLLSQLSPDRRTIEFTLTKEWLGGPSKISFNIITVDYVPSDPGWVGTRDMDYLETPIEISTTHNSTYRGTDREGDCKDPALDIVSWEVEVLLAK